MKKLGWDIRIVPKADIESGIKLARMNFHRIYFDKSAQRLVECLRPSFNNFNGASNFKFCISSSVNLRSNELNPLGMYVLIPECISCRNIFAACSK